MKFTTRLLMAAGVCFYNYIHKKELKKLCDGFIILKE